MSDQILCHKRLWFWANVWIFSYIGNLIHIWFWAKDTHGYDLWKYRGEGVFYGIWEKGTWKFGLKDLNTTHGRGIFHTTDVADIVYIWEFFNQVAYFTSFRSRAKISHTPWLATCILTRSQCPRGTNPRRRTCSIGKRRVSRTWIGKWKALSYKGFVWGKNCISTNCSCRLLAMSSELDPSTHAFISFQPSLEGKNNTGSQTGGSVGKEWGLLENGSQSFL